MEGVVCDFGKTLVVRVGQETTSSSDACRFCETVDPSTGLCNIQTYVKNLLARNDFTADGPLALRGPDAEEHLMTALQESTSLKYLGTGGGSGPKGFDESSDRQQELQPMCKCVCHILSASSEAVETGEPPPPAEVAGAKGSHHHRHPSQRWGTAGLLAGSVVESLQNLGKQLNMGVEPSVSIEPERLKVLGDFAEEIAVPLYSKDWSLVDGAEEFLDDLHKKRKLKIALSTNSSRRGKQMALIRAKLGKRVDFFEEIAVGGGELKKPNRAFFQQIIETGMQLPPSRVLCIGDLLLKDTLCANRSGAIPIWFGTHSVASKDIESNLAALLVTSQQRSRKQAHETSQQTISLPPSGPILSSASQSPVEVFPSFPGSVGGSESPAASNSISSLSSLSSVSAPTPHSTYEVGLSSSRVSELWRSAPLIDTSSLECFTLSHEEDLSVECLQPNSPQCRDAASCQRAIDAATAKSTHASPLPPHCARHDVLCTDFRISHLCQASAWLDLLADATRLLTPCRAFSDGDGTSRGSSDGGVRSLSIGIATAAGQGAAEAPTADESVASLKSESFAACVPPRTLAELRIAAGRRQLARSDERESNGDIARQETEVPRRPLVVAYLFLPFKAKRFHAAGMLDSSLDLVWVPLFPQLPLEPQIQSLSVKVDALLFKVSDFLASTSANHQLLLSELLDLSGHNPAARTASSVIGPTYHSSEIPAICTLGSQRLLIDRTAFLTIAETVCRQVSDQMTPSDRHNSDATPSIRSMRSKQADALTGQGTAGNMERDAEHHQQLTKCRVAEFVSVAIPANFPDDNTGYKETIARKMSEKRIQFPVLAKRRLGAGPESSHELAVAYSLEGLVAFSFDIHQADTPRDDAAASPALLSGDAQNEMAVGVRYNFPSASQGSLTETDTKPLDTASPIEEVEEEPEGVLPFEKLRELARDPKWAKSRVPQGLVVQEFVRHVRRIVHKVFCIGEHVHVACQPSIPDAVSARDESAEFFEQLSSRKRLRDSIGRHTEVLSPKSRLLSSSDAEGSAFVTFMSTELKKSGNRTWAGPVSFGGLKIENAEDDPQLADMALVRTLCAEMRNAFDVDLLGFDILVERDTGSYVIVDVNFMPSFSDFPDLKEVFQDYIHGKVALLQRR